MQSLVAEVGLFPQSLSLAADYLYENPMVSIAKYVERLRALKQHGGLHNQGGAELPQASLGLESLGPRSQRVMLFTAYLRHNFIPW